MSTVRVPRLKLSVRWARDEVPTGPVISASSAGADGAVAVCARAIALPELKSSCATVLVGIHGPQRGPSAPYKLSTRKRSTEGQSEPHERRCARASALAYVRFVSDQQAA